MGVRGDMGNRRSIRKRKAGKSGVVYGPTLYEAPLLPFEKELIKTIGLNEEEYRYFVAEVRKKGKVRPAGYELIPDIKAELTTAAGGLTVLGQILVGVTLTAVSMMLQPKPKAPGAIDRRTLDSITGRSRFSPTRGFESQADLANYGTPIPIIFGRYTETEGGLFVQPPMVWSRMYSYGLEQSVKLMFVVGEQGYEDNNTTDGIVVPDLAGIYLGNTPLDAIYDHTFAFYWKSNTTKSGLSRLRAWNKRYGTIGGPATGDPQVGESGDNLEDAFDCPVSPDGDLRGFSSVHSLSSNAEFGCYEPIHNATPYKLQWQVVGNPEDQGEGHPGTLRKQSWERLKISGDRNGASKYKAGQGGGGWQNKLRSYGMDGTGRAYSRRMGIIKINGAGPTASSGIEEKDINVGDKIIFHISSNKIVQNLYGAENDPERVKIDDINSAIEEDNLAAEDALHLGETYMIGNVIFKVIKRTKAFWNPDESSPGNQEVELECIEVPDSSLRRVGFVDVTKILNPSDGYVADIGHIDDSSTAEHDEHKPAPGIAFYPLMKVARGIVRNTRPCEVTEIGIRSKVFQRLSNLTNFQSIPQPAELKRLDEEAVDITTGTINSYIKRASAFSLEIKKAGETEWNVVNKTFVVVGSRPVDQYNFIRINHPKDSYEYRFTPKNGAALNDLGKDHEVWILAAERQDSESRLTHTQSVGGESFVITTQGQRKTIGDIKSNKEFLNSYSSSASVFTESYPSAIGIHNRLPALDEEEENKVTAISEIGKYSEPTGISGGVRGAFGYELFGAVPSGWPDGAEKSVTKGESIVGNRTMEIRYTAVKYSMPSPMQTATGETYSWNIIRYEVLNSSTGFDYGSEFTITKDVGGSNPFRNTQNSQGTMTKAGIRMRIDGARFGNTNGGRAQGYLWEVLDNADNYDGQSRTQDRTVTKDGKTIKFSIEATSKRWADKEGWEDKPHWSGYSNYWSDVKFTPLTASPSTTNWFVGDTFEDSMDPSADANPVHNNFYVNSWSHSDDPPPPKLGIVYSIDGRSTTIAASASTNADRFFEGQSQYADVSFYQGVEKSSDSNPEHVIIYVNESLANENVPTYDKLTTAGLSLKASRRFSTLDQIGFWLKKGIPVKRWHPDKSLAYGDSANNGPSNLLTDLIYYLLTDQVAGVGKTVNPYRYDDLIDTAALTDTSKFLLENKLFFNGVIDQAVNIRQFISDMAPNFLCNFVISNGKFSIKPALPATSGGEIDLGAVVIKQLFTTGNILKDSFALTYLNAEERKPFKAVVRYKEIKENKLPVEKSIMVRWAATDDSSSVNGQMQFDPIESFDLTSFCTSTVHAEKVAKFFLSIRRRVTHTIEFSTVVDDLILAPGDYIKVVTESNPYSAAKNGTVSGSGVITSASTIAVGNHPVSYYKSGTDEVVDGTMTVDPDGKVSNSTFHSSVFTIKSTSSSANVYIVEQLTMNEDNTVQISASEFPCEESTLKSLIAEDVVNGSFTISD